MEGSDGDEYYSVLSEARKAYEAISTVYCPYFESEVTLSSDGFNHLLYKPNRMPRPVEERKLKLKLLKRALRIIKKANTLQEERLRIEKFGKPARDGFTKTKQVQYWAFHDIVGEKKRFKMRAIVRQVGDGKKMFWSVMPHGKINKQKLYESGLEDE